LPKYSGAVLQCWSYTERRIDIETGKLDGFRNHNFDPAVKITKVEVIINKQEIEFMQTKGVSGPRVNRYRK
jgi:hypothetical protein